MNFTIERDTEREGETIKYLTRRIYPQILRRNTISQRVVGAEEIKDEIIGRASREGK